MAEVRTVTVSGNVSHVVLAGRLDIEGVGKIALPLTAAAVTPRLPAMVDMSGVDFLGSLGIGMLVRCAVSLQRCGARFVLFGCQPLVRKSLETMKLTGVLPLAEDEATAAALLAGHDTV
jgi:anti-anti-sigma factor